MARGKNVREISSLVAPHSGSGLAWNLKFLNHISKFQCHHSVKVLPRVNSFAYCHDDDEPFIPDTC